MEFADEEYDEDLQLTTVDVPHADEEHYAKDYEDMTKTMKIWRLWRYEDHEDEEDYEDMKMEDKLKMNF